MLARLRAFLEAKLPSGGFARSVITLMTGTTFAQALMILVAPILTRLYSPKDFGIFTLYSSVLGILAVVSCGRFELAIVLPEKDEDAANLLFLSILICFLMAGLTLLLAGFFRTWLANLLGAPELAPWLWFLPLSLIAAGLFQAFNYWSIRRKQFSRLSARTIMQSTVTAGAQILGGQTFHAGASGLIAGSIIGQLSATGRLAGQIIRDEGKSLRSFINAADTKRTLLRYKDFPIYSSWSGMLNTASTMLPVLLLGYFFTPSVVGYYALGHRVLTTPMGVIGGSIAQVFYPWANEAKYNGTLDRLTVDMFQRLLAIGFVPILLITIVAPDLFSLIFGARWVTAGEFVRWLSLWSLFVFISSPLSSLFSVMEQQRAGLIINIIMFTTRLLALIMGGIKGDALYTIVLFGITGAALWIGNCIYILHLAGVGAGKAVTVIRDEVMQGLPYALLPIIIWYGSHSSLAFVVAGIGAGIIFLIVKGNRLVKKGI